jgi:hypothetical protein
VLDIAMAEIGLQRAGIVAGIGQRKPASVARHVRMGLDVEAGAGQSTEDGATGLCVLAAAVGLSLRGRRRLVKTPVRTQRGNLVPTHHLELRGSNRILRGF